MAQNNIAKYVQDVVGTAFFDADGDNTAQALKTSAGTILKLHVSNPNAAIMYVQLFDLATGDVTVGTTIPTMSLQIPASSSFTFELDLAFATAITYACTTTATGSTDPGTGLIVNATYL